MSLRVDHEWHGDEIMRRVERAEGRAIVAIGDNVVNFAKVNAHVISGTLRRSIHTAPVNYIGAGDTDAAEVSDLPNIGVLGVKHDENGASLEAGSWVDYACVEEVGRGHMFMTPAVEAVRGPISDAIMRKAFREEGL